MLTLRQTFSKMLVLFFVAMSGSASSAVPPSILRFEQLGQAQGLTTGVVTIAQDRQGFMWFGGSTGFLSRYDGYRITTYKNSPGDPYSLGHGSVRGLYVDDKGRLWVGTLDGIQLYDRPNDRFILYKPNWGKTSDGRRAHISVFKIIDDGRGGLWLGTNDGLQHLDPDTGQFLAYRHDANVQASIVGNNVFDLALDAKSRLWIATPQGLDCLAPGGTTFRHFRIDSAEKPNGKLNTIHSLLVDTDQNLWIGTNFGVESWHLDGEEPQRRRFGVDEGAKTVFIQALYQDRQSNIWVGTLNDGLLRWDAGSKQFVPYRHQRHDLHSLGDNDVEAVFQDQTGTLWLGTWGAGANRTDLESGGFTRLTQDTEKGEKLTDNQIIDMANDPIAKDRIWLATAGGGLSLLDTSTQEAVDVYHGPQLKHDASRDALLAIAPDGKEQFWIGGSAGLAHFNPATRQYIKDVPIAGDATIPVFRIRTDRQGMKWFLTYNGLYRFDSVHNTWTNFKHDKSDPTSLINNAVFCLLEDSHGSIWVGTLDGLDRLDPATGKFTLYRNNPKDSSSLGGNMVSTLFEDSKGNLWVGGDDTLSRMETSASGEVHFHVYQKFGVNAILEDKSGRFWTSDDIGISRFDPASGEIKRYTAGDGMAEGPYFNESAIKGNDGRFYFGSVNGLTAFRPDDIRENSYAPQVLITDFQIFNKSVGVGKGPDGFELKQQIQDTKALTLSYLHSVFSIEFAALHFGDPLRNKFVYQLEGFDKTWIDADATRHFATYTNLDPGNYVFRVKAANKDGVWNDTGAALHITITPPFWKTWWFRTSVAAFLLGIAWAAYRAKVKNLVSQKENLEQQVTLRTSEVVQQKTLVDKKNNDLEKSNNALRIANEIQEKQQSELTRFLAVASHDLRQPMHALSLYLAVLCNVDLPENVQPLLRNISRCAGLMDDMFLALLDLSRLDARLVKPFVTEFPIGLVLEHLEVEFAPQASSKGLTLFIEPCSAWIASDADLIQQILANLVANAVRYTRTGSITVRCHIRNGRMRVAVRDTGIGISPDQQMTVFEEFCQLGNSGGNDSKGLGLGLAIVKRLSKLLSLPVTLVSSLGHGSTFSIEDIPLAEQQVNEMVTLSQIASDIGDKVLSAKTILVIDDDVNILDAMRFLLEQWNCTVLTALSGSEAISMLDAIGQEPDLLVCDYQFRSGENGVDLINKLRKLFKREIPALLITGDTVQEFIQQISESGLPVLYKPVRADDLRDALVRLFRVMSN